MAFDISSYQEGYTDGYEDARKHYDRTAEVLASIERQQGEWIGKEEYDDYPNKTVCECSECGKMICISHNDFPNFCPNCGADMRKGERK